MKVLIIDDEEDAQAILENLIGQYCQNMEVAGIANSVSTGVKAIRELKPDVIFLDINLGKGTGFDVLKEFDEITFDIIFTTAYDHYAIMAIRYAALDYLLKPIDIADLVSATSKAGTRKKENSLENIQALLSNLNSKRIRKLTISNAEEILYIDLSEIIRCEADGGYTHIYLVNNKKMTLSKTLGEYEELLGKEDFMRTHNSHLVNLLHVRKFIKSTDMLAMSDGSLAYVANRKKAEVLERLASFNL